MADATLGTAVLRTRLDTAGLKTGLNQARSETTKATGDMTGAIRGIGAAFGAIAASAGVRSYVSFLSSSANLAHQADAAHRLYEKSLQRTNQSTEQGAQLVRRLAERFGVANSVIEESATLMLRQGASLDDVERALTAAGASAAAAGFDISTAFNNVSTAVATGRSELLETSGIVANLGPVAQQYAKSVGKTVEELTQQELIQARVNAIYRETASEIEDVDEILQGLPLAQARVTQGWRDFREDVGGIAQEVIVPLTNGLGAVLGYVNDLPEPVKRAGIAMAGAAIGATALATGIVAIKAGLQGLSAAGLLSFGPAGWIVLGATAVAGLVAVLTGRPDSLDKAIEKANQALAGGDSGTLTGALDEVITQVDGPVKRVFQELRGEIVETGDVGVAQAQRIANALSLIDELRKAQQRVERATANVQVATSAARSLRESGTAVDPTGDVLFDVDRELTRIQDQLVAMGESILVPFVRFNEELGRFENTAPADVLASVLDPEGVQDVIDSAGQAVAGAMTGTAGLVNEARAELSEAQAQLDAVLARINAPPGGAPTPTPDPTPTPSPGAGPAGTQADPVVVTFADPPITLPDDPTRLPPPGMGRFPEDEDAQAIADAERRARREGLQTELEINAELQRQAAAIRADTNQAIADRAAENEAFNDRLGELAEQMTARADRGDGGLVRQNLMTQLQINADLQAQAAAIRADTQQAMADRRAEQRAFGDRAGALSLQLGARTARGDGGLSLALAQREAAQTIAAFEESERRRAQAIRFSGEAVDAYTAQLQLQTRAIELAAEKGITLTQALQQLNAERDLETQKVLRATDLMRTRESGGVFSRDNPNFLRDSGQAARDRTQQAADRFAETVVDAGFRMGDAAIQAIRDGDIGGILRAGFSGAASIAGNITGLSPIPFLGGAINPAMLIAGGIGLFGTLIGALLGGGRDDSARAAAEQRRVGNVPAININFSVQQTNTYNGAPSDPANEQAFRRQADALFESIYRRHLGPRLDRIEQRLGIAGAA